MSGVADKQTQAMSIYVNKAILELVQNLPDVNQRRWQWLEGRAFASSKWALNNQLEAENKQTNNNGNEIVN